jgi:hypothetical protein
MFLVCAMNLSAQQATFNYSSVDVLRNITIMERWRFGRDPSTDAFITERLSAGLYGTSITEERATGTVWWWRMQITTTGSKVFYSESLNYPPTNLKHGERAYGYVEVRDSETSQILEVWPLFVQVEVKGRLRKSTSRLYLNMNRVMEIVRLYNEGQYLLPNIVETKTYKSGIDPDNVPLLMRPEHYLDAHTITRMQTK